MAIKFEKIVAGMTLYDRHRQRMGNTTMKALGEWPVRVVSVDPENRTAMCSWNGNKPRIYFERQLTKLSTWSMRDPDVVVTRSALFGVVLKVRKMTQKEIAERDAKTKP